MLRLRALRRRAEPSGTSSTSSKVVTEIVSTVWTCGWSGIWRSLHPAHTPFARCEREGNSRSSGKGSSTR